MFFQKIILSFFIIIPITLFATPREPCQELLDNPEGGESDANLSDRLDFDEAYAAIRALRQGTLAERKEFLSPTLLTRALPLFDLAFYLQITAEQSPGIFNEDPAFYTDRARKMAQLQMALGLLLNLKNFSPRTESVTRPPGFFEVNFLPSG
jgi:hypothetical protein